MNLVKALKEIETIDLNQLEKLITLANSMKEMERPQEVQQPVGQIVPQAVAPSPQEVTQGAQI